MWKVAQTTGKQVYQYIHYFGQTMGLKSVNALFVWPSHTSRSQSEIVADPVFKWQEVEKCEHKKGQRLLQGQWIAYSPTKQRADCEEQSGGSL